MSKTRTTRKPRKLARSQRPMSAAAEKVFQAAFGHVERQYATDAKGRKVRVFTREVPCGREDVMELLVNVRAFDEDEALEVVGRNVLDYMVQQGFVRRGVGSPLFFVTNKGAKHYALPSFKLLDGSTARFVD